jgi:hypothetical protein
LHFPLVVGVFVLLSLAFISFFTIVKVESSTPFGFTFGQSIPQDGNSEIQVVQPEGVDVDLEGNLYVNDIEPNKIIKFSKNGTYILSWGSKVQMTASLIIHMVMR